MTRAECARDLKLLRDLVDLACDAAREQDFKRACINWGDLGCVQAFEWVDDMGATGLRVLIEEASPDNAEFCVFVRNWLEKEGWPGVQVDCEW